MFKVLFLSALLAPCAVGAQSLSGTVQDSTKGRIDGAEVTVWDATTGKGIRTISSMGNFFFSSHVEGDYLFKAESKGFMPVYGALHLTGDGPHKINVAMLAMNESQDAVGAGAALRDAIRFGPPQDTPNPDKVQPPKLKKKVTP